MYRPTVVLLSLLCLPAVASAAPSGPHTFSPTCTAPGAGAPSLADRKCVADHHVWLPSGAPGSWEDELVVILPGTDMEPDKHDGLARMAALEGHRAVVLGYDNRHEYLAGQGGIGWICNQILPGDATCAESVVDTILWGPTAAPPLAGHAYDDEDSVQARLLDVLDQLHAQDMLDGVNDLHWDSYASDIAAGTWCNIVVAGFSQGSTVTAVLASQEDLGGAIMLDGPSSVTMVGGSMVPQSWRAGPHATAGAVMFGAYHTTKSISPEDAWSDLGMATGTSFVDETDPATWDLPAGLHRLEVDQTPHTGWGGCTDHFSMARDQCMTLDAGVPILGDAYREMFRLAGTFEDPDCL